MSAITAQELGQLRVLVVEDDPDHAALLTRHLDRNPELELVVSHVASLAEAEERLAADHFDVVLLDLRLPDGQGLRTVQRVTAVDDRPAVVITTSLRDAEMALDAIKLGAQEYLVKDDLTPGLLLRTVRYAVERKSLLRELNRAREAEQRERELRHLERMAVQTSSVTAASFANDPVRTRVQDRFDEVCTEYARIFEQALQARAYDVARPADDLRTLAGVLGFLDATPRDVIEVHARTLRDLLDGTGPDRQRATVEEARILVLELMGYLTSYYRLRARSGGAPSTTDAPRGGNA